MSQPLTAPPSQPRGESLQLARSDTSPDTSLPQTPERLNTWARIWQWVVENSFLPAWLPEPLRHPIGGFVLATIIELIASALTLLLVKAVPTFSFLGTVHILAVAFIALTWGAAPSMFAALVGAFVLEVFVLPQTTGGGIGAPIDLVEASVFLIVGTVIAVIASNTERARRRAVSNFAEARARGMALAETNARTDEFLSIASHELRSPLTSLKAALQLGQRRLRRIADSEQPPDDLKSQIGVVQGLLTTAEHQVDRQDRLVGDLLDVSRIRANKLEFHLTSCDLADIVRDTVDEQRLSWPDRSISLDAPEGAAPIYADAHRIGQVVTNFLTNALKYSPPDAPVRVSLSVGGAEARVAIQDNGPGLTSEQQSHIWDRFHRVPGIKQQSGSGAGLGLGLHISRTIVEYHSGRVGIDSIPKKGSTFWFTLPLARPAEQADDRASAVR